MRRLADRQECGGVAEGRQGCTPGTAAATPYLPTRLACPPLRWADLTPPSDSPVALRRLLHDHHHDLALHVLADLLSRVAAAF